MTERDFLHNGERLEDLMFEGLKIIQNKDLYTFTSDAVILANFVKLRPSQQAVEIGSGSGVISILLSKKQKFKKIFGFEIQKELHDMSERSLKLNRIENVEFINDKIQNLKKYLPAESMDVVFSNPPYKKLDLSTISSSESRLIARQEKYLDLRTLVDCANKLLKFGGKFYVVFDASRVCELVFELSRAQIEPKRMFFTQNGKQKTVLVVIEAVKGGKHGVEILPPIITNDSDGNYIHTLHDLRG